MQCEHIEELLSPYLENELSLEQKQTVTAHLEACSDCRDLLSLMQEVSTSLTAFPEVEVSGELQNRLYAIPEKKTRFRLNLDFLIRPSLQPIMAAATVMLTVVSFYAFNPSRGDINKAVEKQFHTGYQKIGKLYAQAESFTNSLAGQKDILIDTLKTKNPLKKEKE
jgi:predicted anti-sigma-YlaC factor YlaD